MTSQKAHAGKIELRIETYLRENPCPSFSSEIADALGLGYIVSFEAVNELLKQGRIKKAKKQRLAIKTIERRLFL